MSWDEDDVEVIKAAKRLSVVKSLSGSDHFTSYSPRSNSYTASGSWEHWTVLALAILQHPASELVNPEAHAAVKDLPLPRRYSETERSLTEDEIWRLFESGPS